MTRSPLRSREHSQNITESATGKPFLRESSKSDSSVKIQEIVSKNPAEKVKASNALQGPLAASWNAAETNPSQELAPLCLSSTELQSSEADIQSKHVSFSHDCPAVATGQKHVSKDEILKALLQTQSVLTSVQSRKKVAAADKAAEEPSNQTDDLPSIPSVIISHSPPTYPPPPVPPVAGESSN